MRKIVVDIRRNELHTHRADFWPWELPILEFIHVDSVTRVAEIDVDNRVLDPQAEYERLERRFGRDKETHAVRVHQVYGIPPLGIDKLGEAMQEHLDEQAEKDAKAAAELDAAAAAAETEGLPSAELEVAGEDPRQPGPEQSDTAPRRRRASS